MYKLNDRDESGVYIKVYLPNHVLSDRDGWVPEHRLIYFVAHEGIPEGADIHHLDGNPRNNKITNLKALSPKEHQELHDLERKAKAEKDDIPCPACNEPSFLVNRVFFKIENWLLPSSAKGIPHEDLVLRGCMECGVMSLSFEGDHKGFYKILYHEAAWYICGLYGNHLTIETLQSLYVDVYKDFLTWKDFRKDMLFQRKRWAGGKSRLLTD